MEENVRECKSKRLIQGGFIVKFKTENLYLVKICNLVKVVETDTVIRRRIENDGRYILAYSKGSTPSFMTFVDIYTHTVYPILDNTYTTNIPVVVDARSVVTNAKYLTEEEALRILKELNPTYLKEEKTKRLRLFKQ